MKIISICILFFLSWDTAIANDDTDISQAIFPQQITAYDLLKYCSSSSLTDPGRKRQRYCYGFISGAEEAIRLTLHLSGQPVALRICVPDGVTSRNLANAYIQYAGHRDANLTRPAVQVVLEALSNAYPCR